MITEIKNTKFHQQMKGEKIKEMTIVLLLSFNDKVIYDIVANKTNEQLEKRIKEIDTNKIMGWSYVTVTNNYSFVEYKRVIIKENNK